MRRTRSRPFLTAVGLLAGSLFLAACLPPASSTPAPTTTTADPPTIADGSIMGPSELTAAQIAAYVVHVGHGPASPATPSSWKPELSPTQMAQLYLDEGKLVGVRGDLAFCQSIVETGWFTWPDATSFAHVNDAALDPSDPNYTKYLGYVTPADHNYAGIGAYNGSTVFMRQPTAQLGVRAQLQHLRNYADGTSLPTQDSLGAPLVLRPGYTAANFTTFVYHGKAPNWVDLDGKWAVPGTTYGQTILDICNSIRKFSGLQPIPIPPAASGASAQSELAPFDPSQVTFRN